MDTWNGENYPIARFLSETGVESMPSLQTWKESTNASDDLKFDSKLIENREHHGNGQNEMMSVSKFSYQLFILMNILDYKSKII
jgi:hypothetical protein